MTGGTAGELGDVVAELYALPPEEFTPTRDARAKAARADGDADAAGRIRRLAKPSTAAWLVNMLVVHRREELQQLLDVGAALREATSAVDADQLKELNRQAHRVVSVVSRQARALAAELDHPVSQAIEWQVDQTLRAALSDSDAADAVASGQLVKALEPGGFGPVDLTGATADPSGVQAAPRRALRVVRDRPSGAGSTAGSRQQSAAAKAEVALREAQKAVETAEQDERDAQERLAAQTRALDAARDHHDELADEVSGLREQLGRLEQQAARAGNDVRAAERLQRRAEQAAEAAERDVTKARERLERESERSTR